MASMRLRVDGAYWKPEPARPICGAASSRAIWQAPVIARNTQTEAHLVRPDRNWQRHDPPHHRAGGAILRRDAIFPDPDEGPPRRESRLAAAQIPRRRGQADALHPE